MIFLSKVIFKLPSARACMADEIPVGISMAAAFNAAAAIEICKK